MAHLSLSKTTRKNKYVSLLIQYKKEAQNATDPFEKAEAEAYMDDIYEHALFHHGWAYLKDVKERVKAQMA